MNNINNNYKMITKTGSIIDFSDNIEKYEQIKLCKLRGGIILIPIIDKFSNEITNILSTDLTLLQ